MDAMKSSSAQQFNCPSVRPSPHFVVRYLPGWLSTHSPYIDDWLFSCQSTFIHPNRERSWAEQESPQTQWHDSAAVKEHHPSCLLPGNEWRWFSKGNKQNAWTCAMLDQSRAELSWAEERSPSTRMNWISSVAAPPVVLMMSQELNVLSAFNLQVG